MSKKLNILFLGESCIVHTIELKGSDSFTGTRYNEAALVIKEVFEKQGHHFSYIPCHRVHLDFPETPADLAHYDVVLFSDVGAMTFLLHPDTLRFCKRTPNKLAMTADYVRNGGGFIMIGGYMSFGGIDGKGKYHDTVIEELLPVEILPYDDRVEVPEGAELVADPSAHPILEPLPVQWPFILGYNKLIPKASGQVILQHEGDPIIAVGSYGKGRSVAYATDCVAHWAPPEMYQWKQYGTMWERILLWVSGNLN